MLLNQPEVTAQTLARMRQFDSLDWNLAMFLIMVFYVLFTAIEQKKWDQLAAGLALYAVHWFVEIINALVQTFAGHALWTASGGSMFIIMVGVGIEISLMFSICGLVFSKLLPKDKNMKILGINNRVVFAILNALGVALLEIPFALSPAFTWVFPWWGVISVWIVIYIPFFLAAFKCHDAKPKTRRIFIGGLTLLNIIMICIFYPLGWI